MSLDPRTMNYEFCMRTDPGLARENNEDSVATDEPTRLGILADGMGGYNAGEVASGMATTFIKSERRSMCGKGLIPASPPAFERKAPERGFHGGLTFFPISIRRRSSIN